MTIEAVYEKGVLRLLEPIDIAENTPVEVIVIPKEINNRQKHPREILKAIADLPMEGKEEDFSGRDHDQILYSSTEQL